MKKIFILLVCVFTLTACENNISKDYTVNIKSKTKCNNAAKKYYSDDNQTLYLVCVKDITLKDNKNSIKLKTYLNKEENTIDSVTNELILKLMPGSTIMDGSVVVYSDGGTVKYSKNGYTIIKCGTKEGNKDVYIGTDDLDIEKGFKDGFCGH